MIGDKAKIHWGPWQLRFPKRLDNIERCLTNARIAFKNRNFGKYEEYVKEARGDTMAIAYMKRRALFGEMVI